MGCYHSYWTYEHVLWNWEAREDNYIQENIKGCDEQIRGETIKVTKRDGQRTCCTDQSNCCYPLEVCLSRVSKDWNRRSRGVNISPPKVGYTKGDKNTENAYSEDLQETRWFSVCHCTTSGWILEGLHVSTWGQLTCHLPCLTYLSWLFLVNGGSVLWISAFHHSLLHHFRFFVSRDVRERISQGVSPHMQEINPWKLWLQMLLKLTD